MADDKVEVKLGADSAPLKSGMNDASASVAASLKQIADALSKFGTENKRTTQDAIKNNADLSRSFLELKGSMTGGFDAIAGIVARFRVVLGTLTAALGGGAIFKGAVDETLAFNNEIKALILTFGMANDKAVQYAIALKLAGSNADAFSAMAFHVGRTLKTQAEEFDRLKIVYKETNGELLPMETILENVYHRMQDFKAGTDQNLFALTAVGRAAKDFESDMKALGNAQQRAIELQKALGIEWGPDRVAKIAAYKLELNSTKVIISNIAEEIGIKMIPQLKELANTFVTYGPTITKVAVTVGATIIATFQALAMAGRVWAEGTRAAIQVVIDGWVGLGEVIVAVANRQFSEIPGIVKRTMALQLGDVKTGMNSIVDTYKSAFDRIKALYGDGAERKVYGNEGRGNAGGPAGSERFTFKPTSGGAEQSQMSALEAELKRQQDVYERMKLLQGSFERWSLQQTSAYWQQALATAKLSDKDREAVLSKYYDAERGIRLQGFAAEMAALEEEKQGFKFNYDQRIRIAREAAAKIAAAFGVGSAEALRAEQEVTREIQAQAAQRERIADIEQRAATATAKHAIDMSRLQIEQQVALRNISVQQSLESQRDLLQQETDILRSEVKKRIAILAADPNSANRDPVKMAELNAQLLTIEQEYQSRVTQIDNAAELDRKQYAVQAARVVQDSFAGMLADFASGTKSASDVWKSFVRTVTDGISRIAAQMAAQQLFGGGSAGGGLLNSIFGSLFGGGGGGLANAFASAIVPSFAVGSSYVPRDTLAIVHKGEAIIPASQNKPGAMGAGVVQNNHFYLAGAADTRTQDQIAVATARGLSNARRNL